MTSLLHSPARAASGLAADLRHRRPLVLVAALAGLLAALGTLVLCLAVGVVGWFLSDAGAHGTPSEALRVGALGWLLAHGSGIEVAGTTISAVPLGLTLLCGWSCWRLGLGAGDAISGHGPDAERLADGERDYTVPVGAGVFALAYAAMAVLVATLAGSPSAGRVFGWSLLLALGAGGTAIAVGSGRASVWLALLPESVRASVAAARSILLGWLLVSAAVLLIAFVADLDTAINIFSQLHTDAGAVVLYALICVLLLPNAVLFASSYLLGPGFAVGAGTVVAPGAVSLGALPLFPLLAALPDAGDPPAWTPALMALAPLTAAAGVLHAQRRRPTASWEEGAVRGMAGGLLAAVLLCLLSLLAGGAVGPGRMAQVGPFVGDLLIHVLTAFGLAGLVAGLAGVWWQRRSMTRAQGPASATTDTAVRPRASAESAETTEDEDV
ncbi:DUF6350 family protein [Nocardioides insulae]|uniref:cell division protein PerM n=1 Tax=Nocardioides insulae TaxID=394734 RepID=UPI00041FBA05|nr:DUF6350 family protein [Nocardioides insulae]